jgi:hypothetical protein
VIAGMNVNAAPVTIDFEVLSENKIFTTQYPDLASTNAIILRAFTAQINKRIFDR